MKTPRCHSGLLLIPLILCAACGGDGSSSAVALRGQSSRIGAGEAGRFCVELSSGGRAVTATQNDLGWDPNCLALLSGCDIEPATGKQLFTNQRGAGALRAIVISLADVDPIPDGRLYCCPMRATASRGCCTVEVGAATASDPEGRQLATETSAGEICID